MQQDSHPHHQGIYARLGVGWQEHVNFTNICFVWAPFDQDTSHNDYSDRKQQIFILIAGVDLQVQVAMDIASQPCSDSQRVKEAGVPRD